MSNHQQTRRSYDLLAREYARRISDELEHRPRERDLLQRFARHYRGRGLICDLGCGPGHVSRYVRQFHPEIFGLDLAHGCLVEAHQSNPELAFVQGDMLALPIASSTLGGVLAFYSLIHFDWPEVESALREMARVLRPGGGLLLGFHVGNKVEHVNELWGIAVNLDARFFLTEELVSRLRVLDLSITEKFERDPYPEVEYPSVRGYIWATKHEPETSPRPTGRS